MACVEKTEVEKTYATNGETCFEMSVERTNLVTPDDRMIVVEEGEPVDLGMEEISLDECCIRGLTGCIEDPQPDIPISGKWDSEAMTCELTGH